MELRSLGWSYPRIASEVGLPTTTIEGLMQRRKMTKAPRPLAGETLRRLYLDQRLSMTQVAQVLSVPKSNVEYWMNRQGIARRPLLRYARHPFEGDVYEKAYLFGLRLGDLYVTKHGFGILVSTTTTHPAMLNLFRRTFEKYGHVAESPAYNKRTAEYQWVIRAALHPSFSFLLPKTKYFPKWITGGVTFLHFLAGFTDAEGSIGAAFRFRFHTHIIEPHLSISNTNLQLLRHISRLAKLYHPRLRLSRRKGGATSRKGAIRKSDVWEVRVSRRAALGELLRDLPLRQSEKIERASIFLDSLKGCDWQVTRRRFEASKLTTKQGVLELSQLARNVLEG